MAYYRLYHVSEGHFSHFEDFEAEDDVKAIGRARSLAGDHEAELWSRARPVKLFRKAGAYLAGSAVRSCWT